MNYTHSITSKGQITLPKAFRDKLGLDAIGKATLRLNSKNEIVITPPKTLSDIRSLLRQPTYRDQLSPKEQVISSELAKKYGVR